MVGDNIMNLQPPTMEDRSHCLEHMRAWIHLAKAELAAEFPGWEIGQAFQVFGLTRGPDEPVVSDHTSLHLTRLARACQVDSASLIAEFSYHEHTALQLRQQTRCTAKAAWADALRRHSRWQADQPETLKHVLTRWMGFAASTSGQTFLKLT